MAQALRESLKGGKLSLEEIARLLRRAREDRGESIADVEEATKIRARYIEALESGTPERIPGEVFIKGFLRTYGNHLGLDGPALVERYKTLSARATGAEAEQPAGQSAAPAPAAVAPDPPAPAPRLDAAAARPAAVRPPASGPAIRPGRSVAAVHQVAAARHPVPPVRSATPKPAILWGTGLLVVAAALIFGLWQFGGLGGGDPGAGPPASSQPSPAPASAPANPPAPAPAPAPAVKVARGSLRVTPDGNTLPVTVSGAAHITLQAAAGERCWLQVLVDGQTVPVFEGTMEPGETRQWQGAGVLRLRVGYPRGLTTTINGTTFKPIDGTDNPLWLEVSLQK